MQLKIEKAGDGLYRVVDTPFLIERRSRKPEQWGVTHMGDARPILTGKGLCDTLDRLQVIRDGFAS